MDVEAIGSSSTLSTQSRRTSDLSDADVEIPHHSTQSSVTTRSSEPVIPKDDVSQARRKSSIPIVTTAAFEYPRFRYENWEPPLPISKEHDALQAIKREWSSSTTNSNDSQLIICDLEGFTLYVPAWRKYHAYEMRALDTLSSPQTNELMLSGVLTIGGVRRYVQDVTFEGFSVEGYGQVDTADTVLYIRSSTARKDKTSDIWYRLGEPAPEYKPYHLPFRWVATFAKHVIDYLDDSVSDLDGDTSHRIGLSHFRGNFCEWICARFNQNPTFRRWKKAFGKDDFRSTFHANVEFVWHQATDTTNEDERKARLQHPIWNDCGFNGINLETIDVICEKTVTTPFVYKCFKEMYFGQELEQVTPVPSVFEAQTRRKRQLGFANDDLFRAEGTQVISNRKSSRKAPVVIKIGDVISVPPDENGAWKKNVVYHAYVHGIRHRRDYDELKVIWLYCPEDTTIGWSKYPFSKELFFSDHCNCSDHTKLKSTEVIATHTVEWLPSDVNTDRDYFIRTKYLSNGSGFVAFKQSDLKCGCTTEGTTNLQPGDTVYMTKSSASQSGEPRLYPVVVVNHDKPQNQVTVRRLLRTKQDCAHLLDPVRSRLTPDNELTWSDEQMTISARRIERKCHIKSFPEVEVESQGLPFPYDRNGRWDFWFIASHLVTHGEHEPRLMPVTKPLPMVQGLDLRSPPIRQPLAGLSLFSGGGSFDRGLESAGGVHFKHTVDFCEWAVLTQKANAHQPGCRFYQASVDDVLKASILNSDPARSPAIGEVQMIAGGSPCQGCSTLQRDKFSAESLRNVSHITTICSYVDLYRPEYAILENVVNVIDKLKGHERESILSQLIGNLVAMGYQTQYWVQSAWGDGSCQRRSRLFIAVAAPNVKPLTRPEPTHRDPPAHGTNRPKNRGLGTLPCGVRFGYQDPDIAVPFEGVSAKEAIDDLPNIASATSRICVSHPDHRLSEHMSEKHRAIVKHIPTLPYRADYQYALDHKLLPASLIEQRAEIGRAFQRIHPSALMPTITTKTNYRCSRSGNIIHYQQHRPITIREAARTQGWDDEEVVIGAPEMQYKIIGNGVDRAMSTGQGFQFRYAWENSPSEGSNQRHRSPLVSLHDERELDETRNTRIESTRPLPINRKRSVLAVVIPSRPPMPQSKRVKISKNCEDEDKTKSDDAEGRRSSRLTGLEVDFATISWDKIPEKVVKTATRPEVIQGR
ncbi:S-adenosyl-L-methionine-dependent methyltransferase [Lophiostoma macrostomum CBS 122681]|uniref:DNA (cytosine-5-)-methyltransferase n=1 Tax=Lophiostoma macrostomum CBS 122681 TaxID=1314788 RepID=A0A6A6TAR7_9PLEO|nr:S-adenosyl-L-methionine-dependent methyltransferase [Lophiostoma macrostomum CBS 122681]